MKTPVGGESVPSDMGSVDEPTRHLRMARGAPGGWKADVVHEHVELFAGVNRRGEPVLEQVPAEMLEPSRFRVTATPGLAWGCAAGDVLDVHPDGTFDVARRGGSVAIHVTGRLDQSVVDRLRDEFAPLGATVEAPQDLRFAVVTVQVTHGFPAIERATERAIETATRGTVEWHFGNVYDEQGKPLNWWSPPES